jgi:kynureninase
VEGVRAFQLSNPPVLQTVALLGSLEVFAKTSMSALREKSLLLTGYLEMLLTRQIDPAFVAHCLCAADTYLSPPACV